MPDESKVPNLKDPDFLVSRGQMLASQSKTAQELSRERWSDDLNLYHGKFSEKERQFSNFLGTDRLFVPKTYANVQRLLADVMEQFWDDPEEVVDIGSYKNVSHHYRDAVKSLLNYRMNSHPINGYQEFYEAGMDAIRNGVCVLKVYPMIETSDEEEEYERISDTGVISTEKVMRKKIEKYEPRWVTLPPEDVSFHVHATWKDYWKYPIVHRYKGTRAEFKAMGYKNVADVNTQDDPNMNDQIKQQRNEDQNDSYTMDEPIFGNQTIIAYEFWDLMPDEDGQKSGSYVLLGTESGPQVCGRAWEDNDLPLKFSEFEAVRPPIILGNAYPESHVLKGKSFPQFTESLQKEINAIANQEREAVVRALRPHMYINRDAEVDLMSVINRRLGGYSQGSGPAGNAIAEIPSMNPMAISPAHRGRVDQDYFENTSIPPNLLGAGSGEDTATASTQQITNANKKIKFLLKNISTTAFIPGFQYLLRYEQAYASDEFVNQVTGRTLGWVLPDDGFPSRQVIQGDFEIKINLGINKQQQLNKWFLLFDRVNQANLAMAQLVAQQVISPDKAKFKNSMLVLEAALPVLGLRDIGEWDIPAQAPPPQQDAKGVASQPGIPGDASQVDNNLLPQAPLALAQ